MPTSAQHLQLGEQTEGNAASLSENQMKAARLMDIDDHMVGVDKSLVSFEEALTSLMERTSSLNGDSEHEDRALAQLQAKLQKDAASLEQDLASVESRNLARQNSELLATVSKAKQGDEQQTAEATLADAETKEDQADGAEQEEVANI